MKILITGGAGFIGSHIANSLIKNGHDIIVYDNFSTGTRENIDTEKFKIIEGDILDYDKLNKSMADVEIVSHHAAQLEIFVGIDEPEKDLSINTIGTLNVLNAALSNKVKKVINVSSACVYGQTNNAKKENDPTDPNWAYGISKLAAEKYANIYSNYKNLPITNLRYGIVYGENEWFRRVLPIFIKQVILGESPVVFGKGKQIRDFIYVKDVVELHNKCIINDNANGETFNVGSGIPTTILDLAKTACDLVNEDIQVVFENLDEGEFSNLIDGKKRNIDELGVMLLNIEKAQSLLSWKPKVSLYEGMKKEYSWAKNNMHRWEKILSTKW